VYIDVLQLESTSLKKKVKNQTMVTLDARTDYTDGKSDPMQL
jgi:hypothetical protein